MSKYKSLLIKTDWVLAGRVRKCHHDGKHSIVKGDNVLEAADGMAMKGYCELCGLKMIVDAQARLQSLKPLK